MTTLFKDGIAKIRIAMVFFKLVYVRSIKISKIFFAVG